MSILDKNGEFHGVIKRVYRTDSYGEDVEVDEDLDGVDIDDLDVTSADSDYSATYSHYWHGKYVSREQYKANQKRHDKWLKELGKADLPSFQKLLADPEFSTDFLGSLDLQTAVIENKVFTADDFARITSDKKEIADAIAFLAPVKKDFENGIATTFDREGRIEERFQQQGGRRNGFYEKYHFHTGKVVEAGTYRDDQLEGEYKKYDSTGECYCTYHYKKGKLNGPFVCPGKKGNYKDDVLDGPYEMDYRENGVGSYRIGTYHEGKFTGVYCDNKPWEDRILVESYKDDVLDGLCQEYYGFITNFRSSPEHQGYEKQPDGTYALTKLARKCTYKNGQLNGLCQEYYPNGQLRIKCRYLDGKLNGLYEEYTQTGRLERKVVYRDDEVDRSALAKDKTSLLRRGLLKVLDGVDRLPPTAKRQSIKRAVAKGYRLVKPKKASREG